MYGRGTFEPTLVRKDIQTEGGSAGPRRASRHNCAEEDGSRGVELRNSISAVRTVAGN